VIGMKGDPKVLEVLNEALSEELTAINQYFLHAEMCENFGYGKLHQAIFRESVDEMKHAEKLIERILFLEGQPEMTQRAPIRIGAKPEDMLRNDFALETEAVKLYSRAILLCEKQGDLGTRELLQGILADEERHLDWIDTQLGLIQDLGIATYLSRQLEAGEA